MPKLSHEMTLNEYAAHVGVSKAIVSKHAQDRRIPKREEISDGGKKRLYFDPTLCDAAWALNVGPQRSGPERAAPKLAFGVGRPKREHVEARKILASIAEASAPKAEKQPSSKPSAQKQKKAPDGPKSAEEDDGFSDLARRKAFATVEKLEAEAATARVELERIAKVLCYVDDLEELYFSDVADARDKFSYLTTQIKTRFPGVQQELLDFTDAWIKSVFEELGKKRDRDGAHVENKLKDSEIVDKTDFEK